MAYAKINSSMHNYSQKLRTLDDIRSSTAPVLEYSDTVQDRSFRAITYDRNTDHVIAVDTAQSEVCIFDLHRDPGFLLRSFSLKNPRPCTCGVAVLPSGLILVCDYYSNDLKKYTMEGEYQGVLVGNMMGPKGISVGPDGSVYVVETSIKQVHAYDKDGIKRFEAGNNIVDDVERKLPACLEFVLPAKVCAADDGSVYVSDVLAHHVTVFDSDGHFVRRIGGPANLENPCAVALTADGYVAVVSRPRGVREVCFYTVNNHFSHSCSPLGLDGSTFDLTTDQHGYLYSAHTPSMEMSKIVKF